MTPESQNSKKDGEKATQGPETAAEIFAKHLEDGARGATTARGWSRFVNVASANPHLTVENQLALLSQSTTLDHPLGLVASLEAWKTIMNSPTSIGAGEGLLVQHSRDPDQQFVKVYDAAQVSTVGSNVDIPLVELFVLHSVSADEELSRRWPTESAFFGHQDSRVENSIRELLNAELGGLETEVQDIIVSGATYIVQRTLGSQQRAFEALGTSLRSFAPYTDDLEESYSWATLVTNSAQELLRSLGGKFDVNQTFTAESDLVVRLASRIDLENTVDSLEGLANDLVDQEGLPVFGDGFAPLLSESRDSVHELGLIYEDFDSRDLYPDSDDSPSLD